MNEYSTCPIWNTPSVDEPSSGIDGRSVNSPRAGGKYFISGSDAATVGRLDRSIKARLTSWLVEQRRYGAECPEIMEDTLANVQRRRHLSVHERADMLLKILQEKSQHVGQQVKLIIGEIRSTWN